MKLLLLFSYGTTLETWSDVGFLDREYRYYSGLMSRGVSTVRFLTYGKDDKRFADSIAPIEVLPRRGVSHMLLYSFAAVFVHWNSFRDSDLIKSNQSNGAWIGLIAKLLFPGKKLVTRCGWVRTAEMMSRHEKLQGLRRSFVKYVEWLCYRFSNAVIVTTASDKAYLVDSYGIPVEKVTIIPNTVDTTLFAPGEARAEILSDPVRMLAVGRLAHMKNIHSLITAVGRLEGLVSLTIVGGGDYAAELKSLAAEQTCDIRFLENVDNSQLPDIYRRHDIFIMPQLYASGMSKVMIEAMACGLITIGSDLQAHREVIEDGVNGFLCGVDADSIAACTRKIIEERRDLLIGVRETARKNVVERYSMKANVDREYALYGSLLAG